MTVLSVMSSAPSMKGGTMIEKKKKYILLCIQVKLIYRTVKQLQYLSKI